MKFSLETDPVAKNRPRFAVRGKHAVVYDNQGQKKKLFQVLIRNAMIEQDVQKPFEGVLKLSATFYMKIPASISKKKKTALEGTYHSKKPDVDNLAKFLMDCLNGLLIQDDNCIAMLETQKIYSTEPRIEIELIPLEHTSSET